MLKVCVSGLGRAGAQIAKYLITAEQVKLVSAICSPNSWKDGHDLGEVVGCADSSIPVYSSDHLEACIFNTKPDVVIDFSKPFAALQNAELFCKMNIKIVMGTTGFTQSEEKVLFSIVSKNGGGMIYAPNITRGVNAIIFLAELASRIMGNYDIEIVEMHHKSKRDSPSGTALKIADKLQGGRNVFLKSSTTDIPISSIRAGGMISSHKIMLVGENDMIEISHQSFSRDAFAEGAVYAAQFIYDKTGVYEMNDAQNFENIIADYLNCHSANSSNEEVLAN